MDKIPQYIAAAKPNPVTARAPWFKNTFPTYAGIFLWVGFYLELADPALSRMDIGLCLIGLATAGLLCFLLYYYAPAMLGLQSGLPLYIVGTSTFGADGGYLMPGLLMGVLQLGWIAVASWISADFLMKAFHARSRILFVLLVVAWVYSVAWISIKGIRFVARAAQILNWVPFFMIVVVCWANRRGIANYRPSHHDPWSGFLALLAIVIGYFATAGAAGADFGMNNRNRRDVVLGGLTGIVLAIVVAGGLPLLSVAGYLGGGNGRSSYNYASAIGNVGILAPVMFFLFAAASFAPNCFSCLIAANSFETMLPRVPRNISTLIGVTLSALLAVTGVAQNLVGFFTLVGASFGPICGAMTADYFLAGRRWSGPRRGVNWAGYLAWALGFLVGILGQIPGVPSAWIRVDRPAALLSFIVGFVVYFALAGTKLRPPLLSGLQTGDEPNAPLQ